MTPFLIMLTAFILYVGGISLKYGILESISASWYKLPKKWNWLFTLFTFGVGLPMFAYIDHLGYDNGFMFGSGALLCFVGVAVQYKQKLTATVHYFGATGAILLGFTGVIIANQWSFVFLALWVAFLIGYSPSKNKNYTFWAEVTAFGLISLGILIGFVL